MSNSGFVIINGVVYVIETTPLESYEFKIDFDLVKEWKNTELQRGKKNDVSKPYYRKERW